MVVIGAVLRGSGRGWGKGGMISSDSVVKAEAEIEIDRFAFSTYLLTSNTSCCCCGVVVGGDGKRRGQGFGSNAMTYSRREERKEGMQ